MGNPTKLQSVPFALYAASGLQGPAGTNGSNGVDGKSINWRGTLAAAPSSPALNDAYYNSADKKSYVYDINNTWQIISQDGMPISGTAGQTLYYNSTTGWTPNSNLLNDGNQCWHRYYSYYKS